MLKRKQQEKYKKYLKIQRDIERFCFFFVFFFTLSINFAKHVRIWLARLSGVDAGGLTHEFFTLTVYVLKLHRKMYLKVNLLLLRK